MTNVAVDLDAGIKTAIALHRGGSLAEAEAIYVAVLRMLPGNFDALHLLGVLRQQQGRSAEAAELIGAALRQRPDDVVALTNRSAALNALRRFDESLAHCDKALSIKPNYTEALNNRGVALRELNRAQESLASCGRAIRLRPDYADAYNNRGLALQALRRFDEALASYDKALALNPAHIDALNNRGILLYEVRRLDEALATFDRALAVSPDHAHAHWNKAQTLLLAGDFVRGWLEHEWRLHSGHELRRGFDRPRWRGDGPIGGKTILLHEEQGLGDAIQFCRYVALVAGLGARVVLEVQRPLRDLMVSLSGADTVIARGDRLPDFDLHCPLPSLPLAFATRLETIPAQVPYLGPPKDGAAVWEARLGARHPRIGLVWSGNPGHKRDRERSIPFAALLPLLELDATFVSLQKSVRSADAGLLERQRGVIDAADALLTFADTAALISRLDLVVTVDTSVAHLAGALGKPVWILLPYVPDWRWLLDRDDSPWYPTARLFRQDGTRAWDGVVARVRAAAAELIAGKASADQS